VKKYRWLLGAFLFAGFLMNPETTVNAARRAMLSWAETVAPSLLPFMLLMPALTCGDAARVYERMLGWLMRPLFGLPGAAAPAILIGMTAGSPAGAIAAVRISASAGLTEGQLERIVLCVCGLSPAFLLTGIGIGMMKSAQMGRILLFSQMAAQLILLVSTRKYKGKEKKVSPAEHDGALAVTAVLSVCGYMVLFSAAASLITLPLDGGWAGAALLALLDVPSGAALIAGLNMKENVKIAVLCACCGFGGLCICMQNINAVGERGVRMGRYVLFRMLGAAIMSASGLALKKFTFRETLNWKQILPAAALSASILMIPLLISWRKCVFLNKRKFVEKVENAQETAEKPQYNV